MSDPTLIGLVALKQHGKDTVAGLLARHGFKNVAYADRLKSLIMREFDLSVDQVYGELKEVPDERWRSSKGVPRTPRFIMQWLGSEGFRSVDPDFWVKALFLDLAKDTKFVISDVRFQNEIDAIVSRGGQIWVVDMPDKPQGGSWRSNICDRLLKRGPYHQSERIAWQYVTEARRGRLDSSTLYIPLIFGKPELNVRIVATAWQAAVAKRS